MLTCVSILMFPSFNNSMFTEEDGIIINNEDRKKNFKYEKMLKFTQVFFFDIFCLIYIDEM